jgi:hypothetical protein
VSILQRIRDWRHERRIKRLGASCQKAIDAGDRIRTRMYWRLMVDAVKARSAGQVARMNARLGVHS